MSKTVVVVDTEGNVEVLEKTWDKDSSEEYNFLNASVGGWIEAVSLTNDLEGITLWVNEEGKMTGLPYNEKATAVWENSYGFTDVIVGNAVFTGGSDDEGETLSLTENQVKAILSLVA